MAAQNGDFTVRDPQCMKIEMAHSKISIGGGLRASKEMGGLVVLGKLAPAPDLEGRYVHNSGVKTSTSDLWTREPD